MTSYMEDNAFGREFLDDIVEWIRANLQPTDVFTKAQLQAWAEANDYELQEEDE